jgi:hypothetical protein
VRFPLSYPQERLWRLDRLGITLFADTSTDKAELVLEYRTDVLDAPAANRFVHSVAAS